MTWSQLIYFDRATAYVEAERDLVALAIAHNPYGDKNTVPRLWRLLRRQKRDAERGRVREVKRAERSLTREEVEAGLRNLGTMFGGVKRVTISREEMDRKLAGNGARKLGQ